MARKNGPNNLDRPFWAIDFDLKPAVENENNVSLLNE